MEKRKVGQKPKLQLEELRVQSFITELKPELSQTAKGGVVAPGDSTSEIISGATSVIVSQTIKNSGESKWPCRFACGGGGGGDTNSGPNSEP